MLRQRAKNKEVKFLHPKFFKVSGNSYSIKKLNLKKNMRYRGIWALLLDTSPNSADGTTGTRSNYNHIYLFIQCMQHLYSGTLIMRDRICRVYVLKKLNDFK